MIEYRTGYYFKYGTRQDEYRYLNAICAVLDITIRIKNKLLQLLDRDKNQLFIHSLNNGDIRTQFGNIDIQIYINNNEYLEYPLLNDLICIPGVIDKNGLNIIIFQRKIVLLKKL